MIGVAWLLVIIPISACFGYAICAIMSNTSDE